MRQANPSTNASILRNRGGALGIGVSKFYCVCHHVQQLENKRGAYGSCRKTKQGRNEVVKNVSRRGPLDSDTVNCRVKIQEVLRLPCCFAK